jgi:hypothetical protein
MAATAAAVICRAVVTRPATASSGASLLTAIHAVTAAAAA